MEYIYLGTYVLRLSPEGPRPIWSAAEDVATLCIGAWAFTWVKTRPEQLDQMRQSLKLTESQFSELREWCTSAIEDGRIGWSDCFSSLPAARSFQELFFANRRDIEAISLFVDRKIAEEVGDFVPSAGFGQSGHMMVLSKMLSENAVPKGDVLGFDIIGLDLGCLVSFHSERETFPEISELNDFGLIEDEALAHALADAFFADGRAIDGVGSIAAKVVRHKP